MHYSLVLSSLLALASALPVSDPITIFNRAPTPGTVYTRCSTPNTLALAYDDGPYQYTQSLVNKLNQAGAKGTFFFTGTLYGTDIFSLDKGYLLALRLLTALHRVHLQPGGGSQVCVRRRTPSGLAHLDARPRGLHVIIAAHHGDDQAGAGLCQHLRQEAQVHATPVSRDQRQRLLRDEDPRLQHHHQRHRHR